MAIPNTLQVDPEPLADIDQLREIDRYIDYFGDPPPVRDDLADPCGERLLDMLD
jgi:hypothetical protein